MSPEHNNIEDVKIRSYEGINCSSSWFGLSFLKVLEHTFLKTILHVLTYILVPACESEEPMTFIKDLTVERPRHLSIIRLNLSLLSLWYISAP